MTREEAIELNFTVGMILWVVQKHFPVVYTDPENEIGKMYKEMEYYRTEVAHKLGSMIEEQK